MTNNSNSASDSSSASTSTFPDTTSIFFSTPYSYFQIHISTPHTSTVLYFRKISSATFPLDGAHSYKIEK